MPARSASTTKDSSPRSGQAYDVVHRRRIMAWLTALLPILIVGTGAACRTHHQCSGVSASHRGRRIIESRHLSVDMTGCGGEHGGASLRVSRYVGRVLLGVVLVVASSCTVGQLWEHRNPAGNCGYHHLPGVVPSVRARSLSYPRRTWLGPSTILCRCEMEGHGWTRGTWYHPAAYATPVWRRTREVHQVRQDQGNELLCQDAADGGVLRTNGTTTVP